jgi:hypothetical protein
MGGRIETRRGSHRYFLKNAIVKGCIFGEFMFIENIETPFVIKGHERMLKTGSKVSFDFVITDTPKGKQPVVKNLRVFAAT